MSDEIPHVRDDAQLPELTLKAILLSVVLAAILSASNAYLGLKVGLIVSASIPAIMVSMVVFRLFKQHNILEHNIVQTGASASASIASGIVFVLPALLLVKYWSHFDYWLTVFICLSGGLLGILLSIPLRRTLLRQPELSFPEGKAIAEVLKANEKQVHIKDLVWGGLAGAFIQLCQTGFKVMSSSAQLWFKSSTGAFGFSVGFDATLLGVGYLIGFEVGLSILIGAGVGWVIGIPVLSHIYPASPNMADATTYVMSLWDSHLRYIGIGTLLVGGIWSLIACAKPIVHSLKVSAQASFQSQSNAKVHLSRTERDIPLNYILIGITALVAIMAVFIIQNFSMASLGLNAINAPLFYGVNILYLLVAGFVFSAICAYFSGMVGMTASPVSGINIAALILVTLIFQTFISLKASGAPEANAMLINAAGLTIIITTIIACAGTMANGNIQDLKTGQLVGATPWKLEIMLIIGTIVATVVAPPIIDVLYNVYGMGGSMPRPGMDPADMLPAPQAALIAAVSNGMLSHNLPLTMVMIGVVLAVAVLGLNCALKKQKFSVSLIAFAIGIYLPMSITMPLFLGSAIAFLVQRRHRHRRDAHQPEAIERSQRQQHNGILIACGLVAGGSLMGILLAIPFAIAGSPEVLSLVTAGFAPIATTLGALVTVLVCYWLYHRACRD